MGDGAFEDLGFEGGLHEFVVAAVSQRLGFVAAGGGVFGGIRGSFFRETPGENLLGSTRTRPQWDSPRWSGSLASGMKSATFSVATARCSR